MQSSKFWRILFVFLTSSFVSTTAQIVSVPLATTSVTGYQVERSTVNASVGLVDDPFTMYWTINATPVARCQIAASSGCQTLPGTVYENRTASSFISTTFFLLFDTTASDFVTTISVLDSGNEELDAFVFVVTPNCFLCSDNINCSHKNCGLGCTTSLSCLPGYTGNVTGVCQDDALFSENGTCEPVKCKTAEVPCGGCNAFGTEVDFNTTLECSCQGKKYNAYCNASGSWDVSCLPVLCNTNDIVCKWCKIPTNETQEYNTTLNFTSCEGGKGSAHCLGTGEWGVTCTAQCNTSFISCEWCEVPKDEIYDSNYLFESIPCEVGATASAQCLDTGDWNVTCIAQCNTSDIFPCDWCSTENETINYNETYTQTCSDGTISSKCLAAGEWGNTTCKGKQGKSSVPVAAYAVPIACVGCAGIASATIFGYKQLKKKDKPQEPGPTMAEEVANVPLGEIE